MARESTTTRSKGTAQSGRTREAQPRTARSGDRSREPERGRERERPLATSREGTQRGQNQGQNQAQGQGQEQRPYQGQVQGQGLTRRGNGGRLGIGAFGASPFMLMQRMADDMEQFMEEFGFGRPELRSAIMPRFGFSGNGNNVWSPQVEVRQRGNRLMVRADLPGVNRDDIQVNVDNDVLTIRGERRQEREEEREGVYRSERMYGHFARSIPLPEGADPDQFEANFKDGVLEISIPTPEEKQQRSRRIEIR